VFLSINHCIFPPPPQWQRPYHNCHIFSPEAAEQPEDQPVDDRQAVQWMYERLRPGGHLILTVPVDRRYWLEYRDENSYNLQSETNQGYFFQRFFDWSAIETRIIAVIGQQPSIVRWYGENQTGRFAHHVEEWRKKGRAAAVRHPMEMVDHFREFDSWEEMPGIGICGLLFIKPMT